MTDDNYRTIIKFQQEQYENMLMGKIPIVAKKETVALKPCPFCGGSAHVEQSRNGGLYWVECEGCHSRSQSYFDNPCGAIESWNRRVQE